MKLRGSEIFGMLVQEVEDGEEKSAWWPGLASLELRGPCAAMLGVGGNAN